MSTFNEKRTTMILLSNMLFYPDERNLSDARVELRAVVNYHIETVKLMYEVNFDDLIRNMALTWQYREICNFQECLAEYELARYRRRKQEAERLIFDVYYLWHHLMFLYNLCECLHDADAQWVVINLY